MKIALIILGVLAVSVGLILMTVIPVFGTRPSEDEKKKFGQSSHYNSEEGIFQNRRPDLVKEMRKRAFSFKMLKDFFSDGVDRTPSKPLPEIKPDITAFLQPSADLKVIWFGHSSFILNFSGKIILVDPVFSGSAAPLKFLVKRFQQPVLEMKDLPQIDYVLISHDHYDHLDMASVQFFKDKKAKFITPLGVGAHLRGWGIEGSRITEMDWWQDVKLDGLEIIATPAQHFSGRSGLRDNETLWASWVLRNEKLNIYFSGDSGYDTHFKEIGEKYGPFDIAFMESGQYNVLWKEVHMLPEEAIQAYFDLKAKRFFPVHWGMFKLALHTWYDPIAQLQKAVTEKGVNLVSPKLGQTVIVNDDYKNEVWWE